MKKFLLIILMLFGVSSVQAGNFMQSNNPFPQTVPQDMNNLYESEPAVIQSEQKQAKKSWFRKGDNLKEQDKKLKNNAGDISIYPPYNENAAQESGFYTFTTGR